MIRFLLIVFAFLTGCKQGPQAHPFGDFPKPVHVADVVERDMPIYLEVMGRLDSPLTVELRAQVSGRLEAMHVAQGDLVKAGDLLFTLDAAPFQAAVDQAAATLKKNERLLSFAQAKLERYKPLAKQDYVSQLQYDQFQNDVETLTAQTLIDQAALDSARILLSYCSIHARMDGKIGEAHVDPGNLVCSSDAVPLTELRQLDPIHVRFSLAQKDFQTIKAHQSDLSVQILLPGETTPHCLGKVYFIDNHLNLESGSILCKGALENSDFSLWPGEYVRVRLLTKHLPKALLVPLAAVQIGQEGSFVYVVKPDDTVEMRQVQVEAHVDGQAVISKGLNAGEVAVIDGQLNLRPGSKVVKKS